MMTRFFPLLWAQTSSSFNSAAAAPVPGDRPVWTIFVVYGVILAMIYFAFFRPQMQAKKKLEETIKSAKTGDRIVTTGGIHGVITNVKETTVMLRVADNVKLELDKSHIERVTKEANVSEEKALIKAA